MSFALQQSHHEIENEARGSFGYLPFTEYKAKTSSVPYERLEQMQDELTVATVNYLLPVFHYLRRLGGDGNCDAKKNTVTVKCAHPTQKFGSNKPWIDCFEVLSFEAIRRALDILEGSGHKARTSHVHTEEKIDENLIPDANVMTILREMTGAQVQDADSVCHCAGILFPEFLQCYQVVVGGMQGLEMLPSVVEFVVEEMDTNKLCRRVPFLQNVTVERVRNMVRIFRWQETSVVCSPSRNDDRFVGTGRETRKTCSGRNRKMVTFAGVLENEFDYQWYQNRCRELSRRRKKAAGILAFVAIFAFLSFVAGRLILPYWTVTNATDVDLSVNKRRHIDYLQLGNSSEKERAEAWSKRKNLEIQKDWERILESLQKSSEVIESGHLERLRVFQSDVALTLRQMDALLSLSARQIDELKGQNYQMLNLSVRGVTSLESKLTKCMIEGKSKDSIIETNHIALSRCRGDLAVVETTLDDIRGSKNCNQAMSPTAPSLMALNMKMLSLFLSRRKPRHINTIAAAVGSSRESRNIDRLMKRRDLVITAALAPVVAFIKALRRLRSLILKCLKIS